MPHSLARRSGHPGAFVEGYMSWRAWTADEDLVVRYHYRRLPVTDLAAALGLTDAEREAVT